MKPNKTSDSKPLATLLQPCGKQWEFSRGAEVEMVGAPIVFQGHQALIKRTIMRGNQTVAVSTPEGKPLWVARAQTFSTLLTFDGTNGSGATQAFVQSTDGNLYGTTQSGGANDHGTVFKITSEGADHTAQLQRLQRHGRVRHGLQK